MAALGSLKSVTRGERQKLNDAAITTTGTLDFQILHASNHPGDFSGLFVFLGSSTSLTADLQVSIDNGATFVNYSTGVFNAIAASTSKAVTPLFDGVILRVNITTATGVNGDVWLLAN